MRLPKPNNIITEKYVVGMSVFKNRLAKIKLSANESALGPSPKAKKEYIKVSKSFARYPDTNGTFLRETLSKKFKLDKNRIGIQGWSYGGYISSLCITIGADIFKMAIAIAPVTNSFDLETASSIE